MKLPVLITRDTIVFPEHEVQIEVGRDISINAIKLTQNFVPDPNDADSESLRDMILVVPQIDMNQDDITSVDQFYKYGTLSKIKECKQLNANDEEYTLKLMGDSRIKLVDCEYDKEKHCFIASYKEIPNRYVTDGGNVALKEKIIDQLQQLNQLDPSVYAITADEIKQLTNQGHFGKFVDQVALIANFSTADNDYLLGEQSVISRLEKVVSILDNEITKVKKSKQQPKVDSNFSKKVDTEINNKINNDLTKQQREFYLREKLKAIRDELNEDGSEDSVDAIRDKVQSNPYPEHIKKKILSELKRYETAQMQESSMIKSYIDWLVNLPWWQKTTDNKDISKVEEVLNKSHYGLKNVKERILEYLAVFTRKQNSKAPIICLVGPPGVGKTSLAFSIANALGKKCVKVSLGGVRDEAAIKGHRRTYLGSMPGRIITGMKKAGVVNPVFILDEIDKLSAYDSERGGDPANALLEVLDPEQNSRFSDDYIEEDYDLSKVMFITTANYEENIPEALHDRLEIIRLSSYTENEKASIAKEYLIPRTLEAYDLTPEQLSFTDDAIKYLIRSYTMEAGVRELERLIQRIARKFIVRMNKGEIDHQVIDNEAVKTYLKKEMYNYTKRDEEPVPGVVNGMAYTSAGGDLLPIEVTSYKGKGNLTITGNLKETMNESVKVALGFVKANAEKYRLDPNMFSKIDLHVHVPSGGIPKDGPSAGVTLVTAILSCLKKCPVPSTISMTGEIMLRGKVGIIGGVKEKTISAFRSGINEIFMPIDDEKYLDDVPDEIKDKITFHFVKVYDDIYNCLFKRFDEENMNDDQSNLPAIEATKETSDKDDDDQED